MALRWNSCRDAQHQESNEVNVNESALNASSFVDATTLFLKKYTNYYDYC